MSLKAVSYVKGMQNNNWFISGWNLSGKWQYVAVCYDAPTQSIEAQHYLKEISVFSVLRRNVRKSSYEMIEKIINLRNIDSGHQMSLSISHLEKYFHVWRNGGYSGKFWRPVSCESATLSKEQILRYKVYAQ